MLGGNAQCSRKFCDGNQFGSFLKRKKENQLIYLKYSILNNPAIYLNYPTLNNELLHTSNTHFKYPKFTPSITKIWRMISSPVPISKPKLARELRIVWWESLQTTLGRSSIIVLVKGWALVGNANKLY
jgi:hypothetical protein